MPAVDRRLAVRLLGDAAEDLQQGRLAGPVAPMMPTHSPFATLKDTSRSTQCSL